MLSGNTRTAPPSNRIRERNAFNCRPGGGFPSALAGTTIRIEPSALVPDDGSAGVPAAPGSPWPYAKHGAVDAPAPGFAVFTGRQVCVPKAILTNRYEGKSPSRAKVIGHVVSGRSEERRVGKECRCV